MTNIARAFIQWGGFTFGRTVSFTDHEGSLGDFGMRSLHQTQNQSDTGANGTNQIAYTWQLGNGITLNVGADERRVKSIANLSGGAADGRAITQGVDPTSSRAGSNHPNPWVSLRVNQAWGRASVAVIANHNEATYYTDTGGACTGGQTGTTLCGSSGRQVGLGGDRGHRDQARHAEPGQPARLPTSTTASAPRPTAAAATWRAPASIGSGNQIALGVDHRCGVRQRLVPGTDHGLDGGWRLRILLDPQLLEHGLRQLHRGQLQQHRRPPTAGSAAAAVRANSGILTGRPAIRASSTGPSARTTTGSRCRVCGLRST